MSASWLIVVASLLFATMGVCVKLAAAYYGSAEIVMYRGLVGAVMILIISRWRGESMRTAVPVKHFMRSVTGVAALCLWFYAMSELPLATAMTLNYTSSLWLALFLVGSASIFGTKQVDRRLVYAAVLGFTGVVLVLRPTIAQQQLWSRACCPPRATFRSWASGAWVNPRAGSSSISRSAARSAVRP
jgi:S-adenosylmethionine uptake transporter